MNIQNCDMTLSKQHQDYLINQNIRKFLKINRNCNSEKTFFNYIQEYGNNKLFNEISFNCKANICIVYEFYRTAIHYIITRKKYSSHKTFYRIQNRKIYNFGYKYSREERDNMYNKSYSKDYTNFLFDILPNTVFRYNTILCLMFITEYIMSKYSYKLSKIHYSESYYTFHENKLFILINEMSLLIKQIRLNIINREFISKCDTVNDNGIQDCYVII